MQTIDITPTWADVAPILIAAARNGSAAAIAELDRMLTLAQWPMSAASTLQGCSDLTLRCIARVADARGA